MKNVKDQVFEALLKVNENTSDLYPANWAKLPAVQCVEEENKVYERTDNKEDKAYVRYRIDIWNGGSTSEIAQKVDEAVSALGLVRTSCADVPDPSGLRHKQLRYEGIIDMYSDVVYWNG
ncbi:MAG: hypothetical protein Q4C58_14255 [Eubacteriales bacterium]|nr:hypothetical protein [Eubacteriales bacterium]